MAFFTHADHAITILTKKFWSQNCRFGIICLFFRRSELIFFKQKLSNQFIYLFVFAFFEISGERVRILLSQFYFQIGKVVVQYGRYEIYRLSQSKWSQLYLNIALKKF